MRTQCGSWKEGSLGSKLNPSTTSMPSMMTRHDWPASNDSCTPPPDIPNSMCFASRGSTMIECSLGPSGVPSFSLPIHFRYCGSSLIGEYGSHELPPSALRNKPCGAVPANHTPGSLACPGASQNVWLTLRPCSPSGALGNAGGCATSFHVRPPSVDLIMVGPRWPVLVDASMVR